MAKQLYLDVKRNKIGICFAQKQVISHFKTTPMTPKKLWIFSIILLIGHLIIQYVFYVKTDLTESLGIMTFGIDLFSNLILVAIFGAGLGALTALIPFKQKNFKEKFKTTFPLLTSVVLIVLVSTFSYSIYLKKVKGIELRPLHKYEDIRVPVNLDCSLVRNGKFETEKSFIERIENKQTQTDKKTGDKKEFIVEWTNDCEYILTSAEDSSEKLRVKITAVNPDNYDCYVISDKYAEKYPNFLTIKRIK